MATKSIAWNTGSGNINVEYGGSKDGTIVVTSDNNNLYESRSQQIKVKTTDGSNIERTITIQQAAKVRTNISTASVTAAEQTYSGSAKTPTVTVTLIGDVVPSSGYDVAYSDNTNAGTATIIVTGKGDYTGMATGSFIINKVTPTVVAPTAKVLTYNETSQALVNAGSTDFGTLKYSLDNSTWSTSIPTAINQGSYIVYYKVDGDSNVNSVSSSSVACSINEKQVTATIILSETSYTYDGSAKQPTVTVKDGSTIIPSSEYSVSYSNNTNAGTATVTISDNAGGNYEVIGSTTFTIAKADPTYTSPSAVSNLTYSGSSQYLITTGSTNHGTIQYSSNGSTWSTTRPSQTNAGSYTVYWRLVGDNNHNDVSSTSITTTINKASRTIGFVDNYVVLNTSSNVTKTATPSAGSGDGAITYSISSTTYATINSSSGKVTSKTSDGSATVTATIAEGTNYLSASGSYTLYVFATTHNYSYSGSYSSVTLPPGTYQLQCWGAQGGSNAANSTYSITAKAGGKGGYSVGQLTISKATGVRVYVGGQGSSSSGGYNGGGSTTGSSTYNASSELGVSSMGGGGGATDIRLSDGALLSRMIVAGGGSGGAMCYKAVTTSSTDTNSVTSFPSCGLGADFDGANSKWIATTNIKDGTYIYVGGFRGGSFSIVTPTSNGTQYAFTKNFPTTGATMSFASVSTGWNPGSAGYSGIAANSTRNGTVPSDANYLWIVTKYITDYTPKSVSLSITTTITTTSTDSHVGYVGGGTNGVGYSSTYYGKQNGAGTGGAFGTGANMTASNYRYCSGAGGGGWYGGGCAYSGSSMSYVSYMGGGSGWVNTSASAGNRPSGYTGLQLDSGSTTMGIYSFPAPGGGNETGHSGNGYSRITRIS